MRQNASKIQAIRNALVPGLIDILFIVVFILALASGAQMLSIDSDLGRHLTIGNYILDHQIVPTRDLFSYTLSNQPRPPYEWLSQVLFALVNRLLGLDGTILFTAILIALIFSFLFKLASRRCGSPLIAFSVTLLAMGASSIHWLPRPHIFTFLFLAIWVENLEQLRKGGHVKLLTFFLLMLFWANLHGGFVFGILAWCAYSAGWLWTKWQNKADNQTGQKLLLAGLVSLTASVVTPGLWRNWEAVLNNRSSFILSRTAETMPPNLCALSVLPFTLLLILTVILFLANYKTFSASHFFLLAGLGGTSLLISRNIPLFAVACAPIVAELAKDSLTRCKIWTQIEKRFSGFSRQSAWHVFPILITSLTVLFFASQSFHRHRTVFQFDPQVFPVGAMNWLEVHPQSGRMFNEFNWGGYILYRAWPQQQVFLDSQSDFYGEPFMKDYEQVISARGDWKILLEKYEVTWAIIPPALPLAVELKTQGWQPIYEDETAIILLKP